MLGSTLYLPVAYGSDTDKRYQPARDVWEAWEGTGTPRYVYTLFYIILHNISYCKNLFINIVY